MNKKHSIIFFVIVYLIPLLGYSCNTKEVNVDNEEEQTVTPVLTLNIKGDVQIESEASEFIVTIHSNSAWTAQIEQEAAAWLSEKTTTRESLILSAKANSLDESRSALVTIKMNKFDKFETFRVIQKGKINNPVSDDPIALGYTLQSSMQGSSSLTDKDYTQIHNYMRQYGWDYSEHPNSSDLDHKDGTHCLNIYDETLKQHVFQFISHVNPFLDGDRGKLEDRQRNEMKSQTSSSWYKMNGNWDERQWLEWKFKIPKGFRPSTSFCHIHQLKAQEGNNGSPLITITLRGSNDGTNRRVQVIHTGDVSSTNKGTLVDNILMEEFEDEWVQVQEEVHYTHNGFFRIKIIRIRDNKVLIDYSINNIDLWRKGATNIRNKFGIYRSYGKTLSDPNDRPSNGIKDESLLLGDFYIYEKNTNPNPQPHD